MERFAGIVVGCGLSAVIVLMLTGRIRVKIERQYEHRFDMGDPKAAAEIAATLRESLAPPPEPPRLVLDPGTFMVNYRVTRDAEGDPIVHRFHGEA